MLGAIIGDIAGSVFEYRSNIPEFEKESLINPFLKRFCTYTDDTIMTMAVAHTLLEYDFSTQNILNRKQEFKTDLADNMRMFAKVDKTHGGYSSSFKKWLIAPDMGPYGSYGNGSAMRVSPVGYLKGCISAILEVAKLTAEVTHNSKEGIKGAQAVAGAIYMARQDEKYDKGHISTWVSGLGYSFKSTCAELRQRHNAPTCQDTLPCVMAAFEESVDFETCITNAISIGSDTDTVAAIAGSIAEPFYGIPSRFILTVARYLPEEYLDILNSFYSIVEDEFYN